MDQSPPEKVPISLVSLTSSHLLCPCTPPELSRDASYLLEVTSAWVFAISELDFSFSLICPPSPWSASSCSFSASRTLQVLSRGCTVVRLPWIRPLVWLAHLVMQPFLCLHWPSSLSWIVLLDKLALSLSLESFHWLERSGAISTWKRHPRVLPTKKRSHCIIPMISRNNCS